MYFLSWRHPLPRPSGGPFSNDCLTNRTRAAPIRSRVGLDDRLQDGFSSVLIPSRWATGAVFFHISGRSAYVTHSAPEWVGRSFCANGPPDWIPVFSNAGRGHTPTVV